MIAGEITEGAVVEMTVDEIVDFARSFGVGTIGQDQFEAVAADRERLLSEVAELEMQARLERAGRTLS